jgi:hypothetical protein
MKLIMRIGDCSVELEMEDRFGDPSYRTEAVKGAERAVLSLYEQRHKYDAPEPEIKPGDTVMVSDDEE